MPAAEYEEESEVEPRGSPVDADLIASQAFAVKSSRSSLHFRAPGQCPSQDSSTTRQLRASSSAIWEAWISEVCIAYSKMITAELKRF